MRANFLLNQPNMLQPCPQERLFPCADKRNIWSAAVSTGAGKAVVEGVQRPRQAALGNHSREMGLGLLRSPHALWNEHVAVRVDLLRERIVGIPVGAVEIDDVAELP